MKGIALPFSRPLTLGIYPNVFALRMDLIASLLFASLAQEFIGLIILENDIIWCMHLNMGDEPSIAQEAPLRLGICLHSQPITLNV